MRFARPSIRLRLTAWYAGIFLALGAILLVVSYAVVRHEFGHSADRVHVRVVEQIPSFGVGRAPRLSVRIAPGLPPETAVRGLTPDARATYARARAAFRSATQRANDRALRRVLALFALALLAMTIASVIAGWVIAGRALAPI